MPDKPLPPDVLASAKQDTIHKDIGVHRPAVTNKSPMPELTEAEVKEIEERANAATEGPWEVSRDYLGDGVFQEGVVEGICIQRFDAGTGDRVDEENKRRVQRDADFIAHARTDIPRLTEALRAEWRKNDPEGMPEEDRLMTMKAAAAVLRQKLRAKTEECERYRKALGDVCRTVDDWRDAPDPNTKAFLFGAEAYAKAALNPTEGKDDNRDQPIS